MFNEAGIYLKIFTLNHPMFKYEICIKILTL